MNNSILQKAISIAQDLPDQKYKLVAIITDKKGKILSIGKNSFSKSHPTMAYYAEKMGNKHRIYLHAELHALIKLNNTCDPYAIYVVRVNNQGEPLLAKPCEICQQAISDSGIQEIYYTGTKREELKGTKFVAMLKNQRIFK